MTRRAAWSPARRPSRAARRSTGRAAPPVAGIDVVSSKVALSKAPSPSGPYPALMPQICASHLLSLTERRAPIAEDHTPGLEDVRAVGDVERHVRVLLDQKHGRTCGADLADDTEDLFDQKRCEAKRWLVEHEQSWACHERSSDGEHLLLAAAEGSGPLLQPLAQAREILEHARRILACGPQIPSRVPTEQQVLAH